MKRTLALLLALIMAFALIACESAPADTQPAATQPAATEPGATEPAAPADKIVKVGLTFCTGAAPSVKAGWETAEKYVAENYSGKLELIITDGEADAAKQCDQIQNFIAQECDVIILNPISVDGFGNAVKAATDAGIPVIACVQNITDGSDKIAAFIYEDEATMGIKNVEKVVELVGENANIVLNQGALGSSPVVNRTAAMEKLIAEKYPGIKILGQQTTSWDRETARANMEDFLTAYGDQIDAVVAWDDTLAAGSVDALKAAGYNPGDIPVIGYCGMQVIKDYMKEGWVSASQSSDVGLLVKMCIDTAYDLANGKTVPFDQIADQQWITVDNMDQFPWAY